MSEFPELLEFVCCRRAGEGCVVRAREERRGDMITAGIFHDAVDLTGKKYTSLASQYGCHSDLQAGKNESCLHARCNEGKVELEGGFSGGSGKNRAKRSKIVDETIAGNQAITCLFREVRLESIIASKAAT